ncbi:MAG: hypothetical protein COU65_04255 [Candidatus Pacebacteria bacterium CG10_big_fil_rev_8_21_14_0_10_42_12]|nr:MAG: hypothetical protein COU65_04255 [Candidatus Pacebacteria bacterium CG10_big_fil_rev_8_21_14_0_10_42_12]
MTMETRMPSPKKMKGNQPAVSPSEIIAMPAQVKIVETINSSKYFFFEECKISSLCVSVMI